MSLFPQFARADISAGPHSPNEPRATRAARPTECSPPPAHRASPGPWQQDTLIDAPSPTLAPPVTGPSRRTTTAAGRRAAAPARG
ncbi:hypothetical protein ACUY3K_10935 [Corynebacterium uberis]|uniref:hypothetical protein n=1 Tax=Corynebacterium TaxID=1716 RepID=UPI001D0A8D5D|nr:MULTISPECIES: hypothetical protein [Corynebacterium]MCZ9309190.1 hypothetical protein [Corynebacterium sp. c6VSa_13]UDL72750.1 hypothetical protein LH391_06380 [Corynebacterium uberis]UDL76373.1 hypothetical protein LH393_03020 [Corynebacterium uberis]UDL78585.1 hypothetical protein LH394_03005 [Corynebacterium uberis]UDL80866.1 hypothetical protein LH392_03435 [Corynebacterium uberis]